MKMVFRAFIRKPARLLAIVSLFIFLGVLTNCKKNDNNNNNNNNPSDSTKVDLQLAAEGFASPIGIVASPDNTGRLFVIDQVGKIWIIDQNGNKLYTPFMDVSSVLVTLNAGYDERGLLGLAFHPQFATNRRFYIYYQLPPRSGNNLSRISEFQASASDANVADMGTEKILLELDDPQSNHNGGTLAFGPDGFLYISIGDGGSANDVAAGHVDDWYAANGGGNGQDIEANLFGNILRIDVDNGSPYGVPPDNPFVGKAGLDEIYAYGFRNPFRMSFDMEGNHDLIAGDAGQGLFEEINLVTRGGNYGWNVKEGRACFNASSNMTTMPSCPAVDNINNPLIDPVVVVNNSSNPQGGRALTIIGGNVYRGTAIPAYEGKYIFGSFGQGGGTPNAELFISTPAGQNDWGFEEINLVSHQNDIGYYLKGFGQDSNGEIYLTVSSTMGPSGTSGKVFRLIKTS
jgi:glucose/arabinose dehydrogenase